MRILDVGQYDPDRDEITIEGTRYSGFLFRSLGFKNMIGQVLRVDSHVDGVVTVTLLHYLTARLKGAYGKSDVESHRG